MDPALATAAYVAEDAVELSAGAAIAIAQPTLPIKANWRPITDLPNQPGLARHSHSLAVVNGRAYVFGGSTSSSADDGTGAAKGEIGNEVLVVTLPTTDGAEADVKVVPAKPAIAGGKVPVARQGHAATVVDQRIFIFGGRSPNGHLLKDEEEGAVWVFDTSVDVWEYLAPAPRTPTPATRHGHAMTATEHPVPGKSTFRQGARSELERAEKLAQEGRAEDEVSGAVETSLQFGGTLFVHGGVTAHGARESDAWAFDVASRIWRRLPDPPGMGRTGASLAISRDRMYRFGGFDGQRQLGGGIEYLKLSKGTFDDKGGKAEADVVAKRDRWVSVPFPEDKEGKEGIGPGPRSGAGLHAITTGQGRNYLVLVLGERETTEGEDSKGVTGTKYWDDVWAYQVRPEGMSGASFKDAARQLFGAKQYEGTWARVDVPEASMKEGVQPRPGGRGGFASAVLGGVDNAGVMLWGGVGDGEGGKRGNEEGWILSLE